MVEVLLSYDILSIIERTMARHPDNLYVYGEVLNLLVEMNKIVDLKTQPFTDELVHIFGTIFIRFIDSAIVTGPVLDIFAILIENEQNVHWTLIYRQYLIHVHKAMAVHVNHFGIQCAGSHVIMLMTSKELSPNASDNLTSIDRNLTSIDGGCYCPQGNTHLQVGCACSYRLDGRLTFSRTHDTE